MDRYQSGIASGINARTRKKPSAAALRASSRAGIGMAIDIK